MNLRITVGPLRFGAVLEQTLAPKSCAAFLGMLPWRNTLIQARWSGEAAWIPLGDLDFPVPLENPTSNPQPGQLLLHPGDHSETEILFPYGSCRFASKFGPLVGNHFISVVDGAEQLAELGRLVLWNGAQDIVFEAEDTLPSSV